ncbi:BNR/Asp-box repeat protein [Enterococcus italicus DSM 15952]|uniref:BNR/Asp-box repeat protein n=1 Tax=Enterococcus italicus (strain DSM 15952 / CCUG 50447 / LMG 22039 / TP 1.5) TaxID=888064 RepID=E6LG86_ENTI1|nr:exo-alpha-sialidase [Enterococcus italicus]EFU73773.1 BNR/Asp-box repeat protein [Enterococcus italicus DSM 15952]
METILLGQKKIFDNPQYTSYLVEDDSVLSINEGVAFGKKCGETILRITDEASDKSRSISICVKQANTYQVSIPEYDLSKQYQSIIEKSPHTSRQYLGQPDLTQTKTGRLIIAYPIGHGKGPIVMKISDDQGKTWQEKFDIPKSWEDSQETPTIHTLQKSDGQEIIIMISACPGVWGNYTTGWNTSISIDNGDTWSEYKHWHSILPNGEKNFCIVAMASLIQLKDKNGKWIDEWLGVYQDNEFINYKTHLTFDESGEECWSDPEPYLNDYRQLEKEYQICEVGMIRNNQQIIGFCRSQSHRHLSTYIISKDEGNTWSKPKFLPAYLAGERHKPFFDPITGILLVSFREIRYDLNGTGFIEDEEDWKAGNWMLWAGNISDAIKNKNSGFRICLGKDFSPNVNGGDTGYAGAATFKDGKIVLVSYGHWDESFSKNWEGDVRTDLCYIQQVSFKLEELMNDFYSKDY